MVVFRVTRSQGIETWPVVDPKHGGSRIAENPELKKPGQSAGPRLRREAITVKSDMPGLVAQYQRTHLLYGLVANVLPENAVIGGAYQFRQQENLKFAANTDYRAADAERAETPVRLNAITTEAADSLPKQARMLAFFLEPEIHQRSRLLRGIAITGGIPRNQGSGPAAISELKLLDGGQQFRDNMGLQANGQVPLRFRAIDAVCEEVSDPPGGIERFHRSGQRLLCIAK